MIPTTEPGLEELLSRPNARDRAFIGGLDGDLLILGAGGKMGPSLARRARRAADEAGVRKRIVAVARFSKPGLRADLESDGIETLVADLLEESHLAALPELENVVFMAARKFGTTGNEHLTWGLNTYLPARVAERWRGSRLVAFSTGNVYPLVSIHHGGATESMRPDPIGEYAQSALGRERLFEHFSRRYGTRMTLLRLNYAIDLRYGVLVEIGSKVFQRQAIDLGMGFVNVIWQGDANSVCLRSFSLCDSPPAILNLTGPEMLSVRSVAQKFARQFGIEPVFEGTESDVALLSNASRCRELFGPPEVSVDQMIEWIAGWIQLGGVIWAKPTHFETRDGKF